MKTIQDTEQQIETRVYIVSQDSNNLFDGDFSDEKFMGIAEEQGTVYTLKGFQEAFNNLDINISSVIRIINVPL
jgi:hypothetical protein